MQVSVASPIAATNFATYHYNAMKWAGGKFQ